MLDERGVQARVGARSTSPPLSLETGGSSSRSCSRTDAQALERAVLADELGDELVGRRGEQLVGGAVLGETPPSRRIAIRSPILIASSMSWVTKIDRLADLALQAQELVLEAAAGDRVDRAERLVHQHQRRVGGQRARDPDPLPLAARELRPGSGRRSPSGRARRARAARARARGSAPWPSRAGAAPSAMLSLDRHVREQPDLLDHVADPAPQLRSAERRGRCARRS